MKRPLNKKQLKVVDILIECVKDDMNTQDWICTKECNFSSPKTLRVLRSVRSKREIQTDNIHYRMSVLRKHYYEKIKPIYLGKSKK